MNSLNKNQMGILFTIFLVLFSFRSNSQSVGIGTNAPDPLAILDIVVPDTTGNPQGLILPRLWANNITTLAGSLGPAQAGMIVYDLDSNCVHVWDGTAWEDCGGGGSGSDPDWAIGAGTVYNESDNIGIGTSLPMGPFHVAVDQDGTLDSLFIVDGGGNVGIGVVPSGTYKIEIAGNIGTAGINEMSDRRWKKNIQPLNGALGKVLSLQGVTYEWRTDEYPEKNFESSIQIGFVAQQVEKVLPELVDEDANGFKSVEYSKLVSVLTEAMKEQQNQIQSQQQQIDYLKTEIEEMQLQLGASTEDKKQF